MDAACTVKDLIRWASQVGPPALSCVWWTRQSKLFRLIDWAVALYKFQRLKIFSLPIMIGILNFNAHKHVIQEHIQ